LIILSNTKNNNKLENISENYNDPNFEKELDKTVAIVIENDSCNDATINIINENDINIPSQKIFNNNNFPVPINEEFTNSSDNLKNLTNPIPFNHMIAKKLSKLK
jgi:hypothetical protein